MTAANEKRGAHVRAKGKGCIVGSRDVCWARANLWRRSAWFPVVGLLLAAATGQESKTRDEIRPQVSATKQELVGSIKLPGQLQPPRPFVPKNLPSIITPVERNQKKRQLADLRLTFPEPLLPLNGQTPLPLLETTFGTGLGASIVPRITPQPKQIITRITETSPPIDHVTIHEHKEEHKHHHGHEHKHGHHEEHHHGHHEDHHNKHEHDHKHGHHEDHKHHHHEDHHHKHGHEHKHGHHEEHHHGHHEHHKHHHHEDHHHKHGHEHKHGHKEDHHHGHHEDHHHHHHQDHKHHHHESHKHGHHHKEDHKHGHDHKHHHDHHEHHQHHEDHKHHEGHDHKHHHKHHEGHKHHEDHHHKHGHDHHDKHHEDHHHHVFENHDHGHYKSFGHHFESPPVHEEFILSEESAAISVTPPLEDVLKITKSPKTKESLEHPEIAQV
ncbi:hypothetical protein ALC62_09666 [Cyphomyrmex costatus]|uniref:Histidine-rich glycoprotein n=1 Tax=Cyphomyrmex costatus TaxID=456900 RepID=A0A151IFS9_9HYME|nr:hypothetical protein ALC62_09666 [Cyphomyrmex costatus]